MWIFTILPEIAIHAIFAIGVLGLIAGFVLGFIPFIKQYKLPIQIISILIFALGLYLEGGLADNKEWQFKVKELEVKLAKAEAESAKKNIEIQTEIVERVKVVKEKVEVVKREIQIQKEIINADCKLSETAIDLYNKAVAEPTEDKRVGDTK